MDKLWEEKWGSIGLVVMAIFIAINVREDVGVLYALMAITYMILVFSGKIKAIEIISSPLNLVKTMIITGIFFGAWVIVSSFILGMLNPQYQINIMSLDLFKVMSTMADVPVLSTDPTVIMIIWGWFIPIVESVFFMVTVLLMWAVMLGIYKGGQLQWNPKDKRMWMNFILVGISAALFHATIRQYVSYALVADAIFFGLSAMVTFYSKRTNSSKKPHLLEIILGHITNNSLVLWLGGK